MNGGIALILAGALGYVLPTGVLLHQMSMERSAQLPSTFEVAGTLNLAGEDGHRLAGALGLSGPDPLSVAATLAFAPGRCTLSVRPDGAASRSASVTNDRGTLTPPGSGPLAWLTRLGCLPFLFRGEGGEASLEALMRRAGGRFEEPALTLAAGEVGYVLGAGEEGTGKVGLIVKKRGLVPLSTWEEEAGVRVSVDFHGYRPIFHDGGFPLVMELRTGGALVASFVAAQ